MTVTDANVTRELLAAIQQGDDGRVRVMLDRRPELARATTDDGLSVLMLSIYHGQAAMADVLVSRGAPEDIFVATARGSADLVRDLATADPQAVHAYSPDGWTALHLAGHFGQIGVIDALLAAGADIGSRSRNRNGNTPLHAALAGRQWDAATLLIERGADVNATDANGWTPLHLAAHNGGRELVRTLLDHGADPTARTNGKTARDLAAGQGQAVIVEMLPTI